LQGLPKTPRDLFRDLPVIPSNLPRTPRDLPVISQESPSNFPGTSQRHPRDSQHPSQQLAVIEKALQGCQPLLESHIRYRNQPQLLLMYTTQASTVAINKHSTIELVHTYTAPLSDADIMVYNGEGCCSATMA